jgi:hypothetical protein
VVALLQAITGFFNLIKTFRRSVQGFLREGLFLCLGCLILYNTCTMKKLELTPKKLTIKQVKWLISLSLIMAVASITINHTLPNHKWLYWICLIIIYAIPAYVWLEPTIVFLIKGKSKYNAFEDEFNNPKPEL